MNDLERAAVAAEHLDTTMQAMARAVRRALDRADPGGATTVEQHRTLRAIGDAESALTTRLARQMRLSAPAVTERAEALVARGLVERQADPADRRRIRLVLTAAGRAHAAHCERAIFGELCYMVTPLDAERQARLAAAVRDLHSDLRPPRRLPRPGG